MSNHFIGDILCKRNNYAIIMPWKLWIKVKEYKRLMPDNKALRDSIIFRNEEAKWTINT